MMQIKTCVKEIENNFKDLNPPDVLFDTVELLIGAMFLDTSDGSLKNIGFSLQKVWEVLSEFIFYHTVIYIFFQNKKNISVLYEHNVSSFSLLRFIFPFKYLRYFPLLI